jgi:hypothetical protein
MAVHDDAQSYANLALRATADARFGQKQPFVKVMSALPPKADKCGALAYVCFGLIAGKSRPLRDATYTDDLSRIVSARKRCASGHLPRLRSLAAQATEAPLPPDLHLVVSAEQCAHPEIRAHHGASTVLSYSLVGRLPSRDLVFPHPARKRGCVTVTALENASSVPGRTQTATPASSAAANPRVQVPKSRVVSLSPTFAGRDLTL